ncbi:MAG: SSI family serine proteinase inhibitor [Gaiellaceae bacterium]
MRGITVVVLAAATLGACTVGSAGTSPQTRLTVTYWENGLQGASRVTWTLRCNPARGTLRRPGLACRRLAAGGRALFTPPAPDLVCTQIYGGPQVARVVGRVEGKGVWTTFTRANGCQIARWERVSPWLLPPGGLTR